ncbi:bifunctional glycosyltransferase 87/phosphatase PAP2 family protein [Streptomyces albus]|uniref:bifunctional glycosyltransferase 87/phosphatase PAP2 family protein n=1 Tax=Streptomyces albus TaxID=1888 RepID=UPI000691CD68
MEKTGDGRTVANPERSGLGAVAEPAASRAVPAAVALWLIVALLAARQAAAVLQLPPQRRLADLETWIGENGVLRAGQPLYGDGDGADAFTGTPFAGLVLSPLTRAAEQTLGVGWTFGTLLLVVATGLVTARLLPGPRSRNAVLFGAPVALVLLVVSVPVRNTFTLGQTSVLPVLLVLTAFLPRCSARASGVLIGIAAALQPTVLLFAALLWATGRRQAAATAAGTFAACSALAWAASPDDSWTYWLRHAAGAGLGGPADSPANQSLHGLLLRLGAQGPLEVVLFLALAAAVAVLGLRRAARYAADGQWLLAVALAGCVAVAVSPTAWQHQQLWILLAAVGRVGRRRADRLVWPAVVVLVMTLHRDALVPKIEWIGLIGENAPLLAALAAACVVPFLSRAEPEWRRPRPAPQAAPATAGTAAAAAAGRLPLLRSWPRPLTRPNLLLELLLIRVGYWAYSWVRGQAPDGRWLAEHHGWQILEIEAALRIDVELWFNLLVARTGWLESAMNFSYTTFHFLVPLSLLGFMYLRRPVLYRWGRTSLALATLLALIGFWAYPLAPPRLMPGLGFVDTAHGPQDLDHPDFGALTGISNQYAAMPSLHVGWSLWCAVVVWRLTPALWPRVLGVLYPVLTTVVIVGTANHYLLDAAGGVAVVAAGFGLRHLLIGRAAEGAGDAEAPGGAPRERGAGGARAPGVPGAANTPDPVGAAAEAVDAPGSADAVTGADRPG